MRKLTHALVLAGIVAAPGLPAVPAAHAEEDSPHTFTGNVTLASEYIYRGIGQTNREPAIQGGFDYSHSSGFYLGTWASNVSWLSDTGTPGLSNSIEWDFYGGFRGGFANDWTYDVGVLRYYYPGTYPAGFVSPDTTEVYGAIGWKWISLKYSHSTTDLFGWRSPAGQDTEGSGYLDLSASYDLGNGWGINGHVGHQKVKDYDDASYTDWKIGVTKDVGFGTVGLAYIDTNANGDCGVGGTANPYCNVPGKDLGSGRGVITFSKTF